MMIQTTWIKKDTVNYETTHAAVTNFFHKQQIESNNRGPTRYIIIIRDAQTRIHITRPDANWIVQLCRGTTTNGLRKRIRQSQLMVLSCIFTLIESIPRLGWWAAAEDLPDALLHLVTLRVSHPLYVPKIAGQHTIWNAPRRWFL
jgi:hypothetical protein